MGLCMHCGGVLVFLMLGCLLVSRKDIVSCVVLARDMGLNFHGVGGWLGIFV